MRRVRKHSPQKAYLLNIVWGLLAVMLVFGAGFAIWKGTRLPSFTITNVLIEGGVTIPHRVVQEEVEAILEGSYAGLVPRRFTYFAPLSSAETAVSAIPRIKDVVVEKSDRTTLRVAYTEYIPFALWCEEEGSCLFVDEHGYAFTDAPKLSGGSLLRFVIEDKPLLLRQRMIGETVLKKAVTFSDLLKQEFGFVTEQVQIDQGGDITFVLVGGGRLLTHHELLPSATLENLGTVLQSEQFLHLRPTNFKYIDLRFGNKVFVNEEMAVEENASSTEAELPL